MVAPLLLAAEVNRLKIEQLVKLMVEHVIAKVAANVAANVTYCQENKVSYKQLLAELVIL